MRLKHRLAVGNDNDTATISTESDNQHLYAKDFGCKGDGTTNDSACAQKMMDVSRDSGAKHVWFTDGVYKLIDVQVWSGTKVHGGGKFNIDNIKDDESYIQAASHTETKAVFYVDPTDTNDPHYAASSPVARGVEFHDLTIKGLGTYRNTEKTRGIWLKNDSFGAIFNRVSMNYFTYQGILQEKADASAGGAHIENCEIQAAYVYQDEASDYVGAVELRLGENKVIGCSLFAGSNQEATYDTTDMWRTSLLLEENGSHVIDTWVQFGDHGCVVRAPHCMFTDVRADNAQGHGILLKNNGSIYPHYCLFNGLTITNCGQAADNTYDGVNIDTADIQSCEFMGVVVKGESGSKRMRYGLNHQTAMQLASASGHSTNFKSGYMGLKVINTVTDVN